MTDVLNFDFGARNHTPQPQKKTKPKPDIPFTLEADGPVYHMRGEVDAEHVSGLHLLMVRAGDRDDDKAMSAHTQRMLDVLFTPDTVDALLYRVLDPGDYFDTTMFKELVRRVTERAVEEHSGGRPTTSSRTSSGPRRRTGAKSTASSSSKASTSGRSRSTGK